MSKVSKKGATKSRAATNGKATAAEQQAIKATLGLAPEAPTLELLDHAPPAMTRPLALVGGRAYAAAWPWVWETRTEKPQQEGRDRHP